MSNTFKVAISTKEEIMVVSFNATKNTDSHEIAEDGRRFAEQISGLWSVNFMDAFIEKLKEISPMYFRSLAEEDKKFGEYHAD